MNRAVTDEIKCSAQAYIKSVDDNRRTHLFRFMQEIMHNYYFETIVYILLFHSGMLYVYAPIFSAISSDLAVARTVFGVAQETSPGTDRCIDG